MKKLLKILCAVAFLAAGSIGTLSATPLDYDQSLGVFGMYQPGIGGIQYQKWITPKIGLQTQGYVVYSVGNEYHSDTFNFSVSGEFQYKLFETEFTDKAASTLYAWGMLGYTCGIFEHSIYNEELSTYFTDSGFFNNMDFGAGFGFDIMFWNHISVPLEFGIAGSFPYERRVGFCFGSGIRYRFN